MIGRFYAEFRGKGLEGTTSKVLCIGDKKQGIEGVVRSDTVGIRVKLYVSWDNKDWIEIWETTGNYNGDKKEKLLHVIRSDKDA